MTDAEHVQMDSDTFDDIVRAVLTECPLRSQQDARHYLADRGVVDQASAAGWGALPQKQIALVQRLVGRFGVARLVQAGLITVDTAGAAIVQRLAWPHHRLLIPWYGYGVDALVHTLQRRVVGDPPKSRSPRYVFPRGRPPAMYYGAEIAAEELGADAAIAFVEGAMDTLALRRLYDLDGDDNVVVVGVPGVSSWRSNWARLAKGRKAYVAFDGDAAGAAASLCVARDLYNAGAAIVGVLKPTGGKDWADVLRARLQ